MRTVHEVFDDLEDLIVAGKGGKTELLRNWAYEIIDRCAELSIQPVKNEVQKVKELIR